MTRALHWLFPHPLLTVILTIVWVMLQNDVSAGMVVFGIILGIIIPRITAVWWPDRPEGFRAGKMLSYCLVVLYDIVVANIQVAWIILTKSNAQMSPAWVDVPLDLRKPEANTLLAGTITLTPGTVSADLSNEGRILLVHGLDAPDPDAVLDEIKLRD